MSKCPLQAARIYHNRAAFHCGQRKTAVQQSVSVFRYPNCICYRQGWKVQREKLPEQVQYDIRLSDSYLAVEEQYKSALTEPDLEAVVHVYDFRMTLKEMLDYIESGTQPERFAPYQGDLLDYALTANGITYIQRAVKKKNRVHMLCQRMYPAWQIILDY